VVCAGEDAWGDVSCLIDDGVRDVLVDRVMGGGGEGKETSGLRLSGVTCAWVGIAVGSCDMSGL